MSCEHEGIIINPPALPTSKGGTVVYNVTSSWDEATGDNLYENMPSYEELLGDLENGIVPIILMEYTGAKTEIGIREIGYCAGQYESDGVSSICFNTLNGDTFCVNSDGSIS